MNFDDIIPTSKERELGIAIANALLQYATTQIDEYKTKSVLKFSTENLHGKSTASSKSGMVQVTENRQERCRKKKVAADCRIQ